MCFGSDLTFVPARDTLHKLEKSVLWINLEHLYLYNYN